MIDKPQSWDLHIPAALFAYRTTPHSITQLSPYQLVYGRLPRLPIDVSLNELIREVPRDATTYYDFVDTITDIRNYAKVLMEESKTQTFSEGITYENPYRLEDSVWLYTPLIKPGDSKKFSVFWNGPYTVVEVVSPVNCMIEDPKNKHRQLVHISRLKWYRDRNQPTEPPEDLRLEDPPEDDGLHMDDQTRQIDIDTPNNHGNHQDMPETVVGQAHFRMPDSVVGQDGQSVVGHQRQRVEGRSNTRVEEEPDFYAHGRPYFYVEKLLACKKRLHKGRRIRFYLVKWKNYGDEHNSWVPFYRLTHTGLPQQFHAEQDQQESKD